MVFFWVRSIVFLAFGCRQIALFGFVGSPHHICTGKTDILIKDNEVEEAEKNLGSCQPHMMMPFCENN